MNFISVQFSLFLGVTVGLFHLCPARFRALFLLVASYTFYCFDSPLGALGMAGATLFAWLVGLQAGKHVESDPDSERRNPWLFVGIVGLLSWLFFFKTLSPLRGLLEVAKAPPRELVDWLARYGMLPLGISYYTFKLLSYIIDISWGSQKAEKNLVHFFTYASFFPQIVAGPIQRPADFIDQLGGLTPSREFIQRGLRRILLGVFKKSVVADNLTEMIGNAYPHMLLPEHPTTVAFYLFPVQMLADFSALTDVAVGTALLFGIESPENFDYPYIATSISGYWRRWHMTLTMWLNDYVFLPLRMATRTLGKVGLAISLIVNMVLIALWHGLAWTWVVFGLLHGVFLVVDTLTSRSRTTFFKAHPAWDKVANVVGRVFTYHLVAVAMVFVLADSVAQGWSVIGHAWMRPDGLRGIVVGMDNHDAFYGLAGMLLWWLYEYVRTTPVGARIGEKTWARWALYYGALALIVRYGHNAANFIYYKF